MAEPPIREISRGCLRRKFNEAELWERAQIGADGLWYIVEARSHPIRPYGGEPFCTHSEMLSVRDDEARLLARAHRYLRPDGSMGLSGMPDPKMVLGNDGVVYYAIESPDE